MSKIITINGGKRLKGEVIISGSKNAALGVLAAAIICKDIVKVTNLPEIQDIDDFISLLNYLNVKTTRENNSIIIDSREICYRPLINEEVRKIRASYYFMGTLLGLFGKVEILAPGGCNIGERPIDQHILGFEKLGAKCIYENGKYVIDIEPQGNTVVFSKLSVGATINVLLLASQIDGVTVLDNVAKEPEVMEVIRLINLMGGYVRGGGSSTLTIYGKKKLHGAEMNLIADRIEAGTYMIIGASLADDLKISNIIPNHLETLMSILKSMGVKFKTGLNYVRVKSCYNLLPNHIETGPYPTFSTDLQQIFTTLLTQAYGNSSIEETIYSNRTAHVAELSKMGAKLEVNGNKIVIHGPTDLQGALVNGKDLRGGASLVFAGLLAKGTSKITGLKYINRGYHQIVENLANLGADIATVEVDDDEIRL